MNTTICAPPSPNWLQTFATNGEDTRAMKYGYARISPVDHNPAIQLEALQKDGCEEIFTDELTGDSPTERPGLLRCFKTLQAGDTLVVWKLDRLARSVRDLANIGKDLEKRGIVLRSLSDKLPGGKLAFQYFAAIAEFERSIAIERRSAGLQAARNNGVKTGPQNKLSPEQIEEARERIAHGEPRERVAHDYEISRGTLWRCLKNDTPGSSSNRAANANAPAPTVHFITSRPSIPSRTKAASSPKNE